ncbi:hypothetical protein CERZMDRAFT_92761 [Cercospora zeae-maydis SCOH1-5]|uniref:C2H2-type domain-containing protein n=1 Tax=Cercospora zeae-maydis SCOH1-5 TaxID=717836 RepID=A0A6A6FTJ1_9PEZI|nr:hypothetical protein CERZMDRAFT_92761 [Cercospora zeae-maydis SCOH1-5]
MSSPSAACGLANWRTDLWGDHTHARPHELLFESAYSMQSQECDLYNGALAASDHFLLQHSNRAGPSNRSLLQEMIVCVEENCPATREFASKMDMERHKKCGHGVSPEAGPRDWYICPIGGHDGCRKLWPRMDNLRTYVARNHPGFEGVPPWLVDPDMDHTP